MLLLACLLCASCAWVLNPDSDEFTAWTKGLSQRFEKDPKNNLLGVSKLAEALRVIGRERELANLCPDLKVFCRNSKCSNFELYHALNAMHSLECVFKFDDALIAPIREAAKSNQELKEFYQNFFILRNQDQPITQFCSRLREWVPNSGLPRFNPRTETNNLHPAKLIFELAQECGDTGLTNSVLAAFSKRLVKVDNEHTVILDKKSSFLYTSFFLAELLRAKIDGKKFDAFRDNDISGLLNSLVEYGDPSSFMDLKFVFKAAESVQKLGLVVPRIVETKLREEGADDYTLKWEYFDVHGRLVKSGRTIELKAAGAVSKTSNQYVKVSGKVGQSVQVELTQRTEQGLTYVLKESVFPATKLKVQNVQIAHTRGSDRIKDYPLREGDSLSCNQDSKLHIRFEVDKKFDPEYASVYLRHSESTDYSRITSGAGLRFDPEHSRFYGSLDLGDASQIHQISGKYRLSIYIADRSLIEPVQQSVATVTVKFGNEVQVQQILDSAMPMLPEMIPTFYPPRPYSMLVNLFVSALLVAATISILRLQFKQDWNTRLFPQQMQRQKVLYNNCFWMVFAALYGLLVFYWLNERFIDIVFHLAGLMGLALVVGNMAFANLARDATTAQPSEEKEKED